MHNYVRTAVHNKTHPASYDSSNPEQKISPKQKNGARNNCGTAYGTRVSRSGAVTFRSVVHSNSKEISPEARSTMRRRLRYSLTHSLTHSHEQTVHFPVA
jgi:hypothetical protein